jgi:hypothetical protein
MLLLTSLVLALIPLLGVVWIALHGSLTTVDGLFMALILLAISATFGGSALFDLRSRRLGSSAHARVRQGSGSASGAGLVQRGKVERVEFFESHVGQPNKSIVTLSNSAASFHMLVFEGDMRNALPAGQKVEITFRRASGYNVLVSVSYP